MNLLERIWQSKVIQVMALIVGVAAVVDILAPALPSGSPLARWLYVAAISVVVLILIAILLDLAVRRAINQIAAAMAERLGNTAKENAQSCGDREAFLYYAQRYGIAYENLEVECVIRTGGAAEVTRTTTVVAYSHIERLDTFLLIPEAAREGSEWDIDLLSVRSLSPGRRVDYNPATLIDRDGKLSTLLEISPPIIEGQTVKYETVERLPLGLYGIDLSAKEMKNRKTPYDYFGWTINRPTETLHLRVYFPDRLEPAGYGLEVRYASAAPGIPSETLQLEELGRLVGPSLDGPEGGQYSLKLDVDYPMIGLIYILRWEPLRSGEQRVSTPTSVPRSHSPTIPDTSPPRYNTAAIRSLIQDSFDTQDLEQFCQDRATFRPVLVRIGKRASLREIADTLLDYCEQKNLMPELLPEIQAANPKQYAVYEAAVAQSGSTPTESSGDTG